MKHIPAALFFTCLLFALCGCAKQESFEIGFSVPPGNTLEEYVFADEEISPKGRKLRLRAGAGYGEAAVILVQAGPEEESAAGDPIILKQGRSVAVAAEKGTWYRIGIADDNPDAVNKAVSVYAEGVEIRIE